MNEPETLIRTIHYTTLPGNVTRNSDPICLGLYAVSTNSGEVTCKQCLSVIEQRQNMDMGDWLT